MQVIDKFSFDELKKNPNAIRLLEKAAPAVP
jgi:hypothetical protein